MPDMVNSYGTVFGGKIMSWIDMTAGMVAQRHCEKVVVTASIDTISFKAPVYIGDHVILRAKVNYVGNTSMEVGVSVIRENPFTGEKANATTAFLTFVCLDENGRPTTAPKLRPETADEKRRYENAKVRVEARKELVRRLEKKSVID
jgi:acyl-CoA hydrolase